MRMCWAMAAGRAVLMVMVALLVAVLLPVHPAAADTVDWTGEWDTRWRDGGARLILEQDGSTVTGAYPLYDGRIEARVVGRQLRGRWIEEGRQGGFVFVQSRDGQSFTGRYETGEWWTGIRAPDETDSRIPIDQSSPMATMRTFLRAANDTGTGTMELLGTSAKLLHVDPRAELGVDRLDYARLLFEVLDELSFRLWDLPHGIDAEAVTVSLSQAGTDNSFELDFRRIDGRWFIVPPPPEALRAARRELLAARGLTVGAERDPRALATPRDTFKMFLTGMREHAGRHDNPAYATLNTRELSEVIRYRETPLLARYLREVMDRIGYPLWQEIPNDPQSRRPYVHFQHPNGDIAVGPVETEDGVIWQFKPETLRTIRSVYAAMDDMPLPPDVVDVSSSTDIYFAARDFVRQMMPALLTPAGPLEQWQWAALVLAGMFGAGIGFVGSWGGISLSNRFGWTALGHRTEVFVLGWALRLIVFGAAMLLATQALGIPDPLATVITTIGWFLIVASLVPVAWHMIGLMADRYRQREHVMGATLTLVSLASGVARVVMLVGAILLLAHVLSLPYQSVLAGLGIGGLAVALAAQPTLQNLLAGFTLYADKPLSVGDFCRFGDKMGTIEHIGMRSTRIRSLDRTVITVPNSEFANMELENFAQRDRIWLSTVLQLRYETTPDQLRYVLAELRKLLIAHPKVASDPLRVRFVGFGPHSLDIDIFAYIQTPDVNEFHAVREDLFLRIMNLIDEAGTQFAFPSAVHYHAEDKPLDTSRVRASEKKVDDWRAEDRLPFPDYDWHDMAEFSNTLDYPPRGSAMAVYTQEKLPTHEATPDDDEDAKRREGS